MQEARQDKLGSMLESIGIVTCNKEKDPRRERLGFSSGSLSRASESEEDESETEEVERR